MERNDDEFIVVFVVSFLENNDDDSTVLFVVFDVNLAESTR